MNVWKQLRAILLLPGMVVVAIPATILYFTGLNWLPSPWSIVLPVVGNLFVILGLILMAGTIALFITVGKGTLAPLEPATEARRAGRLSARPQPDDRRRLLHPLG